MAADSGDSMQHERDKKGFHGGRRNGAGRKSSVPKLIQLYAVSWYRAEWGKLCEETSRASGSKRLQASWKALNPPRGSEHYKLLTIPARLRVLELAAAEKIPEGEPRIITAAVRALKRSRAILAEPSRVRPRTLRPYSKRQRLLRQIASAASEKYGVEISWQQLRHWNDNYDNLRSLIAG